MTDEYVIVENSRIVAHCCGLRPEGSDCRDVPDGFTFVAGCDVREYDDEMRLRSLADRITDGLVIVSATELVEGEMIRSKNQLERYRDKVDPLPDGQKVVEHPDGQLELAPMTIDERVAAGQLAKEVAFSLKLAMVELQRKAAYADESDPLVMEMTRGEVDGALGRIPTIKDIQAKANEIKARLPKPEPYI